MNSSIHYELQKLRLSGMASEYKRQSLDTKLQSSSFENRLALLIEAEHTFKNNRRIASLFSRAKLRYSQASLEDVVYKPDRCLDRLLINQLASSDWIRQGHSVILTGSTGTGKSWLSCALAAQACRGGLSAFYTTATSLFDNIRLSMMDHSIVKFKRTVCKQSLLIIDDLGMGGIPDDLAHILLEVLDQQSISGAVIITSQFPHTSWHELFSDTTIADAVIDRLIHRAYVIKLEGESMRKASANRKK